jgi:cyclin-dependent kinase 12/13/sacsin
MGCVLGTPAGDGDQRRHRKDQRNGSSEVVNNVVTVRDKQRNRHTGDFPGTLPAIERRKPILDPLAVNQQGWPSWLMAVAGEAIGDWTPRRANTFEKLAKVLPPFLKPFQTINKKMIFFFFLVF